MMRKNTLCTEPGFYFSAGKKGRLLSLLCLSSITDDFASL